MSVRVKIPTILRAQVGGAAEVQGAGDTIRDLLADLERHYPGVTGRILTDDGRLHRFVNLYVNDEDVRYLGSLDAEVHEGDTISILPAVAGGQLLAPRFPPWLGWGRVAGQGSIGGTHARSVAGDRVLRWKDRNRDAWSPPLDPS